MLNYAHLLTNLVVLADYLVADPRMVRDLQGQGVPHLPVRVRDDTGLVGPLVIPGMFSAVLVRGPDPLGAAKIASQTSQAMTGLWADCGHGVGTALALPVPDKPCLGELLARRCREVPFASVHFRQIAKVGGIECGGGRSGSGRSRGSDSAGAVQRSRFLTAP
jgi:hypothetical protein